MKIDRKALAAALGAIRATLSKTPGGSPVLIDPTPDGVRLITTDYNSTSRVHVASEGQLAARIAVDHGTLLAAAGGRGDWRALSATETTLTVSGPNDSVEIPILTGTLPDPVDVGGTAASVDPAAWADAVGGVAFAASSDESSRPNLCGVHLSRDGDDLRLVATDGHRLASRALPGAALDLPEHGIIVPTSAIRASIVDATGPLHITADERHISFQRGEWSLTSRLVDGRYPNVSAVIPAESDSITLDRRELSDALKRLAKFADRQAQFALIEFSEGQCVVSTKGGPTPYRCTLGYDGPPVKMPTIFANAQYLLDALGASDLREARIEPASDLSPIVIDRDAFSVQIVMGLRQ